MHMADALVSPAVGATMWAATAATTAHCAKRLREAPEQGDVPLMGVLGAFVFAAQMVNFTIPGTGSSGHLGGGLILAILLGPEAAFLVIASVLIVQALFFADGGLLALGCNIFNLGFLPAFVAYPLVYRPLAGDRPGRVRLTAAAAAAAIVGLGLGACAVTFETVVSGVSELPFLPFLGLMLSIHLAIGLVEGLVTAAVVGFVRAAQPELLDRTATGPAGRGGRRRALVTLAVAAALAGGVLAWFASASPDGLEWSLERAGRGAEVSPAPTAIGRALAGLQQRTAVLPGYAPKGAAPSGGPGVPDVGTSASGLLGAGVTLALVAGIALALRARARMRGSAKPGSGAPGSDARGSGAPEKDAPAPDRHEH